MTFAEVELRNASGGLDETLQEVSAFLDRLPQLTELVHADLLRGLKLARTGRAGLGAEHALRALILQRIKDWDYRELSERIANGYDLRVFTRFFMDRVFTHDAFNRALNRITPTTMREINDIVIRAARDSHLENGRKLRIDTTVVETDIHYPTDGSLLWDTVRTLTRLVHQLEERLPDGSIEFHDRTRRARRRNYELNRIGRRKGVPAKSKYRDLIKVCEEVVSMSREAVERAKRLGGQDMMDEVMIDALCNEIGEFCDLARGVVDQARRGVLLEESVPASEKIVSIFEPHTDIIVRGKARKPTEFGHKILLCETQSGLVTDYSVLDGNPTDDRWVARSLERHEQMFGLAPEVLAADRGFHSEQNMLTCAEAGVRVASIPKRGGKRSPDEAAREKGRKFKIAQRFRCGIEGRISVLLRGRGMRRCRLHGLRRFEFFVASAVLANNLLRIADQLIARRHESLAGQQVAS